MPKSYEYVFVLWGDEFDEVPATVFVSELREVGLRVKIVGLSSQRMSGAHGLALVPDLTLDQALALAPNTICIIIPFASQGIRRLKNDPRLREFCDQAQANQAKFILGRLNETDIADLNLFPPCSTDVMVYPESENLVVFARDVAGLLSPVV
jgi:hypothetical protein